MLVCSCGSAMVLVSRFDPDGIIPVPDLKDAEGNPWFCPSCKGQPGVLKIGDLEPRRFVSSTPAR